MAFFGPISSLYDFATFAVMLWVFDAGESLVQTGWFVESLATQSLVIFRPRVGPRVGPSLARGITDSERRVAGRAARWVVWHRAQALPGPTPPRPYRASPLR